MARSPAPRSVSPAPRRAAGSRSASPDRRNDRGGGGRQDYRSASPVRRNDRGGDRQGARGGRDDSRGPPPRRRSPPRRSRSPPRRGGRGRSRSRSRGRGTRRELSAEARRGWHDDGAPPDDYDYGTSGNIVQLKGSGRSRVGSEEMGSLSLLSREVLQRVLHALRATELAPSLCVACASLRRECRRQALWHTEVLRIEVLLMDDCQIFATMERSSASSALDAPGSLSDRFLARYEGASERLSKAREMKAKADLVLDIYRGHVSDEWSQTEIQGFKVVCGRVLSHCRGLGLARKIRQLQVHAQMEEDFLHEANDLA